MRVRALVKTHNPATVNPMLKDSSGRLRFLSFIRGRSLKCSRSCCKSGWNGDGCAGCCKIDDEGSHVVMIGAGGCVRTAGGSHPLPCGCESAAWLACKTSASPPETCSL